MRSQNIERRCDERETRRMKAKQSVIKQGGTKQSSPSFPTVGQRVSICSGQQIRWYSVPCHPLFTITYLLPALPCPANLVARRIINVPVLNPCREEATKSLALNLHNSQEQAFRTASNSKYGMNVSHSFKCAQLTKPG